MAVILSTVFDNRIIDIKILHRMIKTMRWSICFIG